MRDHAGRGMSGEWGELSTLVFGFLPASDEKLKSWVYRILWLLSNQNLAFQFVIALYLKN